jgi:hypothetical protein
VTVTGVLFIVEKPEHNGVLPLVPSEAHIYLPFSLFSSTLFGSGSESFEELPPPHAHHAEMGSASSRAQTNSPLSYRASGDKVGKGKQERSDAEEKEEAMYSKGMRSPYLRLNMDFLHATDAHEHSHRLRGAEMEMDPAALASIQVCLSLVIAFSHSSLLNRDVLGTQEWLGVLAELLDVERLQSANFSYLLKVLHLAEDVLPHHRPRVVSEKTPDLMHRLFGIVR